MAINLVVLRGNLVKQPQLEQTPTGKTYCQFTLAVPRDYKNQDGIYEPDFIRCTAWRHTAEFICNHFQKGSGIIVEGRLRVDTYDDVNGKRQWSTQVIVKQVDFGGNKQSQAKSEQTSQQNTQTSFSDSFIDNLPNIPMEDEELPF